MSSKLTAAKRILIHLYLNPVPDNGYTGNGKATVDEIGEAVRCSRAYTHQVLTDLEEKGLVGHINLHIGNTRMRNWYLNIPGMILGGALYRELEEMGYTSLDSYWNGIGEAEA